MALRIEEDVGGLEVAVQNISRVEVLETLHDLVDDVLFVDVLEDARSDHRVHVDLHCFEHEVDVLVVLRPDNILQPDDVLVVPQFLQEEDLAESALRVCRVLKGIEILLESDCVAIALVRGLPDDPVGPLSKLGSHLVAFQHMRFDFTRAAVLVTHPAVRNI